jgi:hypothetical protein
MIKLKIMSSRVRDYFGYVQFPMIAYLFLKQTGFDMVVAAVVAVVSCCVLAVVDWKFIYPAEQRNVMLKNPEWVRMAGKVDELLEHFKHENA